jgi:hypothetical protein
MLQEVIAILEKIEEELRKRGTKYFCGAEPGKLYPTPVPDALNKK